MHRGLAVVFAAAILGGACSATSADAPSDRRVAPAAATPSADTAPPPPTATPIPTVEPTPPPTPELATLRGTVVSAADGSPVPGATVTIASTSVVTGADGSFVIEDTHVGTEVEVARPAWNDTAVTWETGQPLEVALEPHTVRAVRVSRQVAADPGLFDDLLALVDGTVVNTLVFDTKDEGDQVLYETNVAFANDIGAVDPVYDPLDLLEMARRQGLYAITRIVTFEDPNWAEAVPEARLAGDWVNAANPANWEYPLALAVEACALGFDEVQFDYVRFPSGETAARARELVPSTEEERAAAIAGFLGEARARLHPMGCGVSAAVFGIVMSSATDERLGQTPETVSAVVDAVSPMLYPSHYSPGWLGFADPNDHPGPVIAFALDEGEERMAPGSLMRPWIQGFSYNAAQVQAQMTEAEARGAGWMIWNVFGDYRRDWLPSS